MGASTIFLVLMEGGVCVFGQAFLGGPRGPNCEYLLGGGVGGGSKWRHNDSIISSDEKSWTRNLP